MKKIIILSIILFSSVYSILLSAIPNWEMKPKNDDVEFYNPVLSYDGKKALGLNYNDSLEMYVAELINTADGKVKWSFNCPEMDDDGLAVFDFADDKTVIAGSDQKLSFIDIESGKVIDTLKYFTDTWKNISIKNLMRPDSSKRRKFDVAIFSSILGFQVVDLTNRKTIYSCDDNQRERTFDFMGEFLVFKYGSDSTYIFNLVEKKLVYKFDNDEMDLSSRVEHNVIAYKNAVVIYSDDYILLKNLKNQKELKIEGDPSSYDYVNVNFSENTAYLFINDDENFSLYDVNNCELFAKMEEDSVVGLTDYIYETPDKKSVIAFNYDPSDSKCIIYKIDKNSKTPAWKNELFEYKGSFTTNHLLESQGSKIFKGVLAAALAPRYGYGRPRFGFRFGSPTSFNVNEEYSLRKVECDANCKLLSMDENNLSVLCMGNLEMILGDDTKEENAFVNIDIKTGKSLKYKPLELFDEMPTEVAAKYDIKKINLTPYFVGKNCLYLFDNFDVQKIEFPNQILKLNNEDFDFVTFTAKNEDNEYFDHWLVTLNDKNQPVKTFLARSTYSIPFNYDIKNSKYSIYIDEDSLRVFNLIQPKAIDVELTKPLWSCNIEDIDYSNYETVPEEVKNHFIQGLIPVNDFIVIANYKNLTFIDIANKTFTKHEYAFDFENTKFDMKCINNYLVYNTSNYFKVYNVNPKINPKDKALYETETDAITKILYNEEKNCLLLFNEKEVYTFFDFNQ